MNLDGLSLSPLAVELNSKLTGARIDRIFQPDKYTLIFWLRQTGETFTLFISANPENPRICLTNTVPQNPPVPPVFTMLLRKHLEDGRIAKIEQNGLDRIVTVCVDVRGERGLIVTKELTVEIMGKHSNIILIQSGVIIDAIRRVGSNMSRFRQILPGQEYFAPPGQEKLNLFTSQSSYFIDCLRRTPNKQMTLAKAIVENASGIGPLSAKEIAWRAGLPADMAIEKLDEADYGALTEAVSDLMTPFVNGEILPTIVVTNDSSRMLAIAAFCPKHLESNKLLHFENMSEALEYAATFQGRPENPEKIVLQKLVANEITRLMRKDTVLTGEIAEAEQAEILRRQADILMANFHTVPNGASEAHLPNLYANDPESEMIELKLNPLYTPLQNAQQLYVKYNKLKRAQESLTLQIDECRREIAYLDSIAVALKNSSTLEDAVEIRQELIVAGYIKEKTKRRPEKPTPPMTAHSSEGLTILVGKNNRQNDLITFKQAQPDDLWFHTKDIPGSHVILRCSGIEPSFQAITEAATLAARFSKAGDSSNIPVDYTRRRYVKKPAGAKPGFVTYDHQKTLFVTPETEIIEKLLNNNKH